VTCDCADHPISHAKGRHWADANSLPGQYLRIRMDDDKTTDNDIQGFAPLGLVQVTRI
jgi:hypothetical protein